MRLKKILSLCLIIAIAVSCFNLVFAEDEVTVISVGKPITSIYYDGVTTPYYDDTKPPSNANDGDTGTIYYSYAGTGNQDGLIIDLQDDYKIAYAQLIFTGGTPEYSVFVSKTADFSSDTYQLTEQNGELSPPIEQAEETFRYAKLLVSADAQRFRVKEFTIYGSGTTTGGNQPPQPTQPPQANTESKTLPAFGNKKINVALNKKAVAKMYNEGGFYSTFSQMTHAAGLAVDGITGENNDNAFISAYADEDWLRVDLGEAVKISEVKITGYPQYNGAKVDNVPDWYVVTASNSECSYDEAFPESEYVVLEGGFTDTTGIFHLPAEYQDRKFRYFQIAKPERAGVLDAMIVREFEVNVNEKDLTLVSSLNKPVIRDGVIYYNDVLTDGNNQTAANYQNAVIDLLTPSYIKDITAVGENTSGIAYYGGVENSDVSAMKLISANPDEKYRYIYVDNSAGANISEIEITTYFADVISVWSYDEEKNIYSVNVKNGDALADRNYTAIVSQIAADGSVLTTDSQKLTLKAEGEGKFEIFPEYAYGVDRVVCNIFREDIIALTNPTVFIAGENKTQLITSDGTIAADKSLTDCVENESINNGIKIKAKAVSNIEATDVYSIIISDPQGNIVGYMSENATSTDALYEYVAAAAAPEGAYQVIVSLTDPNLKTYFKNYTFTNVYPTADEITSCITDFKTTDGSNFSTLYDTYYVQKRVVDFAELSFIDDVDVFGRIGPIFAWARDNMSKWSEKSSIENTNDILNCFKAALIIDAAMYEDISLLSAVKLYCEEMSKIFKEDSTVAAGLYKYTDTAYETVLNNLITCNALAAIKGKTVTQIVNALSTYSAELKVDIAKLNKKKIDLYEIAKRLDSTIPNSYYDGLSDEIDTIIKGLPKVESDGDTSKGSGGGGGASAPSFSVVAVPEKQEQPKEETKEEVIAPLYSDVSDTHWAKSNIEQLTQKGILNGTSDKTFEPDRQITRAEFVKVVVSAFEMTTSPDVKLTFKDCDVNDWFYPYVDAGVSNKIISGVSVDEFCPDKNILRQDAAVILDNVLLYLGCAMREPKAVSFTDTHEISSYAIEAVKLLVDCGIINGMDDGSFAPKGELTRAQTATLIVKLMDFVGGEVSR